MPGVLVRACDLSVRYGATVALTEVDIDIAPGEVHAVVGENGAGKSTLLRAIAGVIQPTDGRVERRAQSIEWVAQETLLPPDFTASEWIFLGRELRNRVGLLQQQAMREAAAVALRAVGCSAAPHQQLGTLRLPQRKQVQLARALQARPGLLLLDEPTAVLGDAETQQLFSMVRRLRDQGAGILYVSHRLEEVLTIADRVTVLRDGRHVSTDPVAAVDVATLVKRMVGRDVPQRRRSAPAAGAAALRLTDVATAHVHGLSLTVHHGEIVGMAGLLGAGRSEVLEAVARLRPVDAGRIECFAVVAFVPEDRTSRGLVQTLNLRENIFLPADGWALRASVERVVAREWIARLGIRTSGSEAALDSLSGGNQQKVLLARALRHAPQVLLLDEPTAGVDVGAKMEIHDLIRRLADAGTAILLASSDLPELLMLCDRIVALRGGRAVGSVPIAEADEPHLAALITGADVQRLGVGGEEVGTA